VTCRGTLDDLGEIGEGLLPAFLPLGPGPVGIPGLDDVTALAGGGLTVCALRSDASVRCWGGDGAGQLGDGPDETMGSATPVTVALPP
jgi:hypothetical protein